MTSVEMSTVSPSGAGEAMTFPRDHRGSWIPTWTMITTRFMELRKRRGLMSALLVVNIGLPVIFLSVRLIAHAVDPKSYGPAGGYSIFTGLVVGVLFGFGFIVAATLGCSAGSTDLTEGMFRHLVITGRSRLALYFARIPAGMAIVVPMVAAGFAIVCAVCVFAAPTQLNYDGLNVPPQLSLTGFESWATQHPKEVVCGLPYRINKPAPGHKSQVFVGVPCGIGPHGQIQSPPGANLNKITPATWRADAKTVAKQDYTDYQKQFITPPISLMVKTGLWIELEAIIGLVVGLGLASLLGQRTISVVLMIVLEVILTPLFSRVSIPHLINAQRGLVGLAMSHIEPKALPALFGGGNGPNGAGHLVPESTTVAVIVIVAWLVGWTALGAWRMARRDA
jgi:hypothetical protein